MADVEMLTRGFYNQQQEIAFLKHTIAAMDAANKRAAENRAILEEEDGGEKQKREQRV